MSILDIFRSKFIVQVEADRIHLQIECSSTKLFCHMFEPWS